MNKRDMSERDICTKFITPAVKLAGWDEMTQLREEAFADLRSTAPAGMTSHPASGANLVARQPQDRRCALLNWRWESWPSR